MANKIQHKTEVALNINGEYRISINEQKHTYEWFSTKTEFMRYVKENFKSVHSRLRDAKTLSKYKGDWDAYIIITSGEYKSSFAMVNQLGSVMSRFDSTKTRNAWTMTSGKKARAVEGQGNHFDVRQWSINKDYEKFTKQKVNGRKNQFGVAAEVHGKEWENALAEMLVSCTEEERNKVYRLVQVKLLKRKESEEETKQQLSEHDLSVDAIISMIDEPQQPQQPIVEVEPEPEQQPIVEDVKPSKSAETTIKILDINETVLSVWSSESPVMLNREMIKMRRLFNDDNQFIETVHNVGFKHKTFSKFKSKINTTYKNSGIKQAA